METEDIPPTTLKPAPVTVAWEIMTAAVPVLVRVKVWGLLAPGATFPKFKLVALAARVPDEDEVEPDFGVVPAPVEATQPESDSTASPARIRETMPSGARRSGVT
jgi:hypothetical protein